MSETDISSEKLTGGRAAKAARGAPVRAAKPAVARKARGRSRRDHETREDEYRAHEQREGVGGEFMGRLHIDPNVLNPDYEHTWIREEALGEKDRSNISFALNQQRYQPCRVSDYPGMEKITLPGETADALIREGGLLLCRRPKAIAARERNEQLRRDQDARAQAANRLRETRAQSDDRYLQPLKEEGIRSGTGKGYETADAPGRASRFPDE